MTKITEALANLIGHAKWVSHHFDIHYAHLAEAEAALASLPYYGRCSPLQRRPIMTSIPIKIDEEALDKAAREEYAVRCQTHGPRVLAEYASAGIMDMQLSKARVIVTTYLAALAPSDAEPDADEAAIDALRHKAFMSNSEADRQAYFDAVSKWFQHRHYRRMVHPDSYSEAVREALEEVKADRLRQIDYGCDLQRIIEDLCHGRDIREPKTSAVYYYNMAVAFRAALNGEVKK